MLPELLKVVSNHVQLPHLPEEELLHLDLQNYGLDSIKTISLILDLEEELELVFPDELLLFENISTLAKIQDSIEKIKPTLKSS